MERMTLECNDLKCRHHWEALINPDRVQKSKFIGRIVYGCEICPKCGRLDAPYVIIDPAEEVISFSLN